MMYYGKEIDNRKYNTYIIQFYHAMKIYFIDDKNIIRTTKLNIYRSSYKLCRQM